MFDNNRNDIIIIGWYFSKRSGEFYIMSNYIKAQMFGNFSMLYNGEPLVAEKMHRDSQFNRLMQVLIHYSGAGVPKDKLEEMIIGDRDMDESHTSLRIIVYKAKQKLQKLGVNVDNMIQLEKGIYSLNPEIQVVEDAKEFLIAYESAELYDPINHKEAIDACLEQYLEACYLYKGEFLANYAGEQWVAHEAKRYRKIFKLCVEAAAGLLREKQDWKELEHLGNHASRVEPFCDWEVLTMEALVYSNQYDRATTFYADTIDSYLRDCGIYPSTKMIDIMDSLGNQMDHPIGILDDIQEYLTEHSGNFVGGYQCSFPVFRGIYQMTLRGMERTGQNAFLMLCTLVDGNGKLMPDSKLYDYVERFVESIRVSLRHGDVYTAYGNAQCLVLLTNTTRENCEVIQERINNRFIIGRQKVFIKYHVNSVICDS